MNFGFRRNDSGQVAGDYLRRSSGTTDRWSCPVSAQDVESLFNILLRRSVGNDEYIAEQVKSGRTVRDLAAEIANSVEHRMLIAGDCGFPYLEGSNNEADVSVDDASYIAPDQLRVSPNDVNRIMLVGSCLMDEWPMLLSQSHPDLQIDRSVFNNASHLPDLDEQQAATYAFQICQIPLRSVMPEGAYCSLKYNAEDDYQRVFEECVVRLDRNFDAITRYCRENKIHTFVLNFIVPQRNPMGRLNDRYHLSNLAYFVERLNHHLYELARSSQNCFIIDFDEIAAVYGKKYISDDVVSHFSHGSFLRGIELFEDKNRIEPAGDVVAIYNPQIRKITEAVYADALAAYRSSKQVDSIKLVVFDLDDTLWRGVAAEADAVSYEMSEGWPISIVEAASYLWRRGILLAIVSKNDEATALSIWDNLYGSLFSSDNFVAKRINWGSKAENIREIMTAVNVLPQNVLFVDDNPVERAAVKSQFPDIRVMDAPLAHWRRILLWSAETQQMVITSEAAARTEMIAAQIKREEVRTSVSREEFLAKLQLKARMSVMNSPADTKFDRCFELINKTNQFNTTGKRWSIVEFQEFLNRGGRIITCEVRDVFTQYGIVGVLLVSNGNIDQFVLSCRVFGMDIERACVAFAVNLMREQHEQVTALLEETAKNKLCLELYRDCGFVSDDGRLWSKYAQGDEVIPSHIALEGH